MTLRKITLIAPVLLFLSQGVFADESAVPPPQQYQQQPDYGQPPQYPDQYGGGGGGWYQNQFAFQDDCHCQPPFFPPPFNPWANFYCGNQCLPPVLPFPPQPPLVGYPPISGGPAPIYPPVRPWGPSPGYGPGIPPIHPGFYPPRYGGGIGMRPGFGGIGLRPRFGYHRASAQGCEVQQGNNGQFSVISVEGKILFSSQATHAQENAEAMKNYYETSAAGLCGTIEPSAAPIGI